MPPATSKRSFTKIQGPETSRNTQPASIINSSNELVQAAFNLAKLDEAVSRSPVQKIWLFKETLRAISSITSSRAELSVSPERLTASLAGLPLTGDKDFGSLKAAHTLLGDAVAVWSPDYRSLLSEQPGDLRLWGDIVSPTPRGKQEAALARLVTSIQGPLLERLSAKEAPLIREYKALWTCFTDGLCSGTIQLFAPHLFSYTGSTRTPLPCIAASLSRPETSRRNDWIKSNLIRLSGHCERGLEDLNLLEQFIQKGLATIGPKRNNSKMALAFLTCVALPMVTPPALASALNCSRQASAAFLRDLKQLGLLTELSKRERWKIYRANVGLPIAQEFAHSVLEIPFSPTFEEERQVGVAQKVTAKRMVYTRWDQDIGALLDELDQASKRALNIAKREIHRLENTERII